MFAGRLDTIFYMCRVMRSGLECETCVARAELGGFRSLETLSREVPVLWARGSQTTVKEVLGTTPEEARVPKRCNAWPIIPYEYVRY
jgi:hypothetical protein